MTDRGGDDIDGGDVVTEATEAPDAFLEALAETPPGEVLPRRTVIDDQYRIERVIGEGGMGVVYLARDLRLDRDVAIKVGIERSAAALGGIAREALALARLSHPNVVVIHQVGEIGGRSYVAMEYVPGGTARRWCAGRSVREIVAVYIAAGHGLAAAHAAGLVHRDFKPDNVLVGADGRPRVADFGLVRSDYVAAPGTAREVTGVLGTPAYMAPEQRAGGVVDARADQFAFCVSLWEALFGERPFAERTTARPDVPAPAPIRQPRCNVPRHIEAALRRGMAIDRDARWPALGPLLAELRRDPTRRRVAILGATGVIAIGAIATAIASRRAPEDPCAAAGSEIASSWSGDRGATVRANLAPTAAPAWVAEEAARAQGSLDRWSSRWAGAARSVCEAKGRGWSPALADRGHACLAQRRRELAATVDVLATTAGLAGHVDAVVDAIGSPEPCTDAAFLSASVPPPEDRAVAREVDAVRGQVATADALMAAGHATAASAALAKIVAAAAHLTYKPLLAAIAYERGLVASEAVDHAAAFAAYHECYFLARAGGDELLATKCASAGALALLDLSRDVEAVDWAHLAEADATAAASIRAQAEAAGALAVVMKDHGDPKQALAYADRDVDLSRQLDVAIPQALRARSAIRDLLADYPGALADLDEAMRIVVARYVEHPEVADIERERALVLLHLRRNTDAVAAGQRALDIAEHLQGKDSEAALNAVATLAATLEAVGRYDEASAAFVRSIAHDDPHSFNLASDLNNRGELELKMKRSAAAIATFGEASATFAEVLGPDGYEVGIVELNLWSALDDAHRVADAAPHAARALAILAKTPDAPIYGKALIAQGASETAGGDVSHAAAHLALGLPKLDDDPHWRIRALVELARADPARAPALLARARDDAKAAGETAQLAEIESSLARLK